jgi:hypothetical protein
MQTKIGFESEFKKMQEIELSFTIPFVWRKLEFQYSKYRLPVVLLYSISMVYLKAFLTTNPYQSCSADPHIIPGTDNPDSDVTRLVFTFLA